MRNTQFLNIFFFTQAPVLEVVYAYLKKDLFLNMHMQYIYINFKWP